jgi:hypothetical protein
VVGCQPFGWEDERPIGSRVPSKQVIVLQGFFFGVFGVLSQAGKVKLDSAIFLERE